MNSKIKSTIPIMQRSFTLTEDTMEETRILLIDDEDQVRLNLKAFLEDENFVVEESATAEEGLLLLNENKFDVAIVDMRLPGMNGNQFIETACEIQKNLRFLIHTGSLLYDLPKRFEKIGITSKDLFYKPIREMKWISDRIQEVIGK